MPFFVFYAIILALYWKAPRIFPRNVLLLLASWFFYSVGEIRFLPVLLFFTSLDFLCAKLIAKAQARGRDSEAFRIICFSVVSNVALLSFFKLSWFLASEWPALQKFYITSPEHILLPIGISFYTFQSLSYTIDVYRRRIPVCTNFIDFALYVAFFPQLIAGPIERGNHLLPQLRTHYLDRVPTLEMCQQAAWLIFLGVLKKVVIADRLMPYTRWGVSELQLSHGWDVWLASTVFILEFLCDFSAYTDIALGLALLFGIRLTENFRSPYFATSPQKFWQRWHITLGAWFRDYLYTPLQQWGCPRWIAVIATMMVVGAWHGAEPKFIVWGAAWGVLLVGDSLWRKARAALWPARVSDELNLWRRLEGLMGWSFVMICWIVLGFLFVTHSLRDSLTLFERALKFTSSSRTLPDLQSAVFLLAPFVFVEVMQWRTSNRFFWFRWPLVWRVLWILLLVLFILGNYATGENEFIYFAF